MLALYLVCLALGGTLILASILLGGGHHFDHSVGDDAGDHDGGLHVKDFPLDKALDLVKDLPIAKDLPVDKAFDLVKDLAKDVPHDATPVTDGQTPMDQTVASSHPSSGGDLGGPGLRALVSLRFWTFGLAAFGFLGALLHVMGVRRARRRSRVGAGRCGARLRRGLDLLEALAQRGERHHLARPIRGARRARSSSRSGSAARGRSASRCRGNTRSSPPEPTTHASWGCGSACSS